MRTANSTNVFPKSVDVQSDALTVEWSNGGKRRYSAVLLRQACPCAKCVSEITGEVMLNRAAVPLDLQLTSAEPVGRYGVTFGFSDNHATGIYAFGFLFGLPEAFVTDTVHAEAKAEPAPAHDCGGCGHDHKH